MRLLKLSVSIRHESVGEQQLSPRVRWRQHPLHREAFSDLSQNKGSDFKSREKGRVFTAKLVFPLTFYKLENAHVCLHSYRYILELPL